MSASWRLTAWLGVVAIATEGLSASVMYSMSNLYLAITSGHKRSFWENIVLALGMVTIQACLYAYKTYLREKCSVFWRKNLVDQLHSQLSQVYDVPVPNTDQRITQDSDLLCDELSRLVEKTIVLPLSIAFFSGYLVYNFGFLSWVSCLIYFAAGAVASSALANKIVSLVYNQGQYEGDFRLLHSHYMTHKSLIKLLFGGPAEQATLKRSFNVLIWNKQSIILQTLYLNMCTQWFAYAGAIASYFIIGLALLYPEEINVYSLFTFSTSSGLTSEQRIVLLSRGSYACMNLIHALTNALAVYSLYVNYKRIEDILPRLDVLYLLLCNYNRHHSGRGVSVFSAERLCACFTFLTSKRRESPADKDEESALEEGLLLSQYHSISEDAPPATPRATALFPPKPTDHMFLRLQHFTLRLAPSSGADRVLVDDLTLTLDYGMRLMITGRTGVGKSQLLHCIARLFHDSPSPGDSLPYSEAQGILGSGAEQISSEFDNVWVDKALSQDDLYVCPQAPYHMLQETVWDYLHYPQVVDGFAAVTADHKRVIYSALEHCKVLDKFALPNKAGGKAGSEARSLIDGIIVCLQNSHMHTMSLGEKQTLSVVRYLVRTLRRPAAFGSVKRLVLLDEATSAVDEETEHTLYQAITAHCDTFISVGHRSTIRSFHTHQLHLYPDGSFSLTSITPV